jgi:formyltetrahydrofolate deformylase
MIVRIQCTDAVGLVATITSAFANRQLNIISLREHVELSEGQFFMRLHADACEDVEGLERELKAVLPADAVVAVSPVPAKRIVVLVTREYHCLGDILLRHHFNTLGAKVVAVIGNHDHLRDLCHKFDVPFILVSHEGRSKESFEAAIEMNWPRMSTITLCWPSLCGYCRLLLWPKGPWVLSIFIIPFYRHLQEQAHTGRPIQGV